MSPPSMDGAVRNQLVPGTYTLCAPKPIIITPPLPHWGAEVQSRPFLHLESDRWRQAGRACVA